MDLSSIASTAMEIVSNKHSSKKRRVELPLKKRYQNHDATAFVPLSFINRNGSPTDDRASSDDSALPKTPCSAQSSSSSSSPIDVEDCSTFALDFTLPNRSRAKLRHGQYEYSKKEIAADQDQIDHGFESASTSSVTSIQEEPLDLTEKIHPLPPLDAIGQRARELELQTAAALASYPFGLFGHATTLPFSTSSAVQSPNPALVNYANFSSQSISGGSLTPAGQQSSNSKRSKSISSKQAKKCDLSKSHSDYSASSLMSSKNLNSLMNLSPPDDQCAEQDEDALLNKLRRNYKNMTVERRMEANARERTRVHTIGAAFDRLRKLIPSSTADQKLSKLSILRIACRYIMLLASMNGLDYSLEQRGYTVEECIDMLTDTINVESKFKRVP